MMFGVTGLRRWAHGMAERTAGVRDTRRRAAALLRVTPAPPRLTLGSAWEEALNEVLTPDAAADAEAEPASARRSHHDPGSRVAAPGAARPTPAAPNGRRPAPTRRAAVDPPARVLPAAAAAASLAPILDRYRASVRAGRRPRAPGARPSVTRGTRRPTVAMALASPQGALQRVVDGVARRLRPGAPGAPAHVEGPDAAVATAIAASLCRTIEPAAVPPGVLDRLMRRARPSGGLEGTRSARPPAGLVDSLLRDGERTKAPARPESIGGTTPRRSRIGEPPDGLRAPARLPVSSEFERPFGSEDLPLHPVGISSPLSAPAPDVPLSVAPQTARSLNRVAPPSATPAPPPLLPSTITQPPAWGLTGPHARLATRAEDSTVEDEDLSVLAEKICRILGDEARRHGIARG